MVMMVLMVLTMFRCWLDRTIAYDNQTWLQNYWCVLNLANAKSNETRRQLQDNAWQAIGAQTKTI